MCSEGCWIGRRRKKWPIHLGRRLVDLPVIKRRDQSLVEANKDTNKYSSWYYLTFAKHVGAKATKRASFFWKRCILTWNFCYLQWRIYSLSEPMVNMMLCIAHICRFFTLKKLIDLWREWRKSMIDCFCLKIDCAIEVFSSKVGTKSGTLKRPTNVIVFHFSFFFLCRQPVVFQTNKNFILQ